MIATKAGADLEPACAPRDAALVTGAASGIGYATAMRLARGGFVVFAGVRRERDAETLVREGGANVRPLLLDVTDAASIERAAAAVAAARDVRLVGLVNNAGIAIAGPLEIVPLAELRRQFEVNVFGAIALVQTFAPTLRTARGRIVNVSSIGGKLAAPFVGAYAASKFALEAASDALRIELRSSGVHVAVVEPGAVKTPIWERSTEASLQLFETVAPERRAVYDESLRNMVRLSERMARQGIPPERVAEAIERALVSASPRARYLVGGDARLRLAVARLPERLRDRLVAAAVGAPNRAPKAPKSEEPRSLRKRGVPT